MDSITQITLGAAVAELVAGKKLGNRAVLWGAVAGTIPDLDIISSLFMDDVDSLAFHRGISHSFSFAIVGAFVFGWLIHRLYNSSYHKIIAFASWALFFGVIFLGVNWNLFSGNVQIPKLFLSTATLAAAWYYIYKKYFISTLQIPDANQSVWIKLFFWSIITHPILDSFTTYGTQLLQPFSSYRAAIGNISVADPLYTIPFLACVIIMSFFHRSSRRRRIINLAGIIISSAYMIFTLYNKQRVDHIFEQSLIAADLVADKYMTGPTILNNVLWHGAAVVDSTIVYGRYSFYDKKKEFKFNYLPINEAMLDEKEDDRTINTLKWFSDGFYTVLRRGDGRLQFNDMRYGTFTDHGKIEDQFIFKFLLSKDGSGYYDMKEERRRPDDNVNEMVNELWTRIKGI